MKEIKMPSMSPTMEAGKIVKWSKKEGEAVKRGDVLLEIETDKAVMEYESEEEGVVGKIIREEGEEVKVGEAIAVLLEAGEKADILNSYKPSYVEQQTTSNSAAGKNSNVQKASSAANTDSSVTTLVTPSATLASNSNKGSRVFISPLAKSIALKEGLDISRIIGSGPNGRVVKKDVLDFIASGVNNQKESGTGSNKTNNVISQEEFTDIPNSGMRKTIAKRLLESKATIPHFYLNVDCNVEELLKARVAINAQGKDQFKISINDFIIKAVALSMKKVPEANSYWQDETTRQFSRQDVAVAVAIPNGLITPIIRDAGVKGLVEISNEMKSLAKKAKEGKLKPNEYQGGGFSISNLGMFGIDSFSAIVNPPQSGILAVGSIVKKPVVKNDTIAIGNILSITLSADHRVLDGAVAATFLVQVKQYLENPATMLL